MAEYPNVFQPTFEELKSGYSIQRKRRSEVIKNDNPIVEDLG